MKTADPELMRAINRFHVMDAIRQHGPISRIEISERTELSPATVSAITAALLEDALITATRILPNGGTTRIPANGGITPIGTTRGRPRVMLELNPGAAHVVGVKLRPEAISVAVTDFVSAPLATLDMPIRTERQSLAVVADIVEDGVRHCVADAGLDMIRIRGVCVGVPGVVETSSGICRRSPIFGSETIPFAVELEARLGVPIKLESDVSLITAAEHWFGHGRGQDNFLVVSIEHSVGIGIMLKGELHRGCHGMSPDFGWVAGMAGAGTRSLEEIWLDVGKAGPAEAVAATRRAGDVIGIALANIGNLLAPPLMIVSGNGLRLGDLLTGPLLESFEAGLSPAVRGLIEVVFHEWPDDVWARGAAALVLRDLYGSPWSTSGPTPARRSIDETTKQDARELIS